MLLCGLLLAACSFPAAGHAADGPAPPRAARVAAGTQVQLVPSSRTAGQWTTARPRVRDLRPKARGTFD
jgi:hypothetical protein